MHHLNADQLAETLALALGALGHDVAQAISMFRCSHS
ncbi:hypothetical protein JOM49_004334 [Amycolatopsis magusensis]|uniref:ANTAR domain-containing protein n=1 Tax=Amycolatopsis magusensis TaxID=882444 RepID=A0ABS4PTQ2_9PSEU|nr:hypothetical protein [Amycolatopsis magusensis]